MKTKFKFLIGVIFISVLSTSSWAQSSNIHHDEKNESLTRSGDYVNIGMRKEVLEDRVRAKVLLNINERSAELIADGIDAVESTKLAIAALEHKQKENAVDNIAVALGKLETVKLRNPDMLSIPISRVVRTDDKDADLSDIKQVKKDIVEALDQNKFHLARKALESLISEVRIETTNIPTGTYPDILKEALVTIEKGDYMTSKSRLNTLLNTLVVTKQEISLPCMRAEVLLEESLTIQPGHTDAIANRKLLLDNAQNQISIAYELGQVKKDSSDKIIKWIDESIQSLGTASFRGNVEKTIQLILESKNEYAQDNLLNI